MFTHALTPIWNVTSVTDSFVWFERLGWRRCWGWPSEAAPTFGAVGSGLCEIFLCQGAQGGRGRGTNASTRDHQDQDRGVWASAWVDDVDAVHAACVKAGLDVTMPPTDEPWGVREVHVRHPDGHVLRVSQRARAEHAS